MDRSELDEDGTTLMDVGAGGRPSSSAAVKASAGGQAAAVPVTKGLIGRRVGSYRIVRLIGDGGAGEVYLAEQPLINSRVAIKLLHAGLADSPKMLERFIQEARSANGIRSPHMVRVTEFGRLESGRPFAVMEYLEGRPLDAVIAQEAPLPLARVARLIGQVAEGMAAAHDAEIVHRDLKPANLFVEHRPDRGGEFIRVLDFGIAKLLRAEADGPTPGTGFLGTLRYCAPEQLGHGLVGPTADIYSLGCIAYEMLSRQPPLDGTSIELIVRKTAADPPDLKSLCPEFPAEFSDLVMQMMAWEPGDRPASMRAIAAALARWSGEDSRAKRSRSSLLWPAITVGVAAGLAAAVSFGGEPRAEETAVVRSALVPPQVTALARVAPVTPTSDPLEEAVQGATPEKTVKVVRKKVLRKRSRRARALKRSSKELRSKPRAIDSNPRDPKTKLLLDPYSSQSER